MLALTSAVSIGGRFQWFLRTSCVEPLENIEEYEMAWHGTSRCHHVLVGPSSHYPGVTLSSEKLDPETIDIRSATADL